jgi:hypothetical protein
MERWYPTDPLGAPARSTVALTAHAPWQMGAQALWAEQKAPLVKAPAELVTQGLVHTFGELLQAEAKRVVCVIGNIPCSIARPCAATVSSRAKPMAPVEQMSLTQSSMYSPAWAHAAAAATVNAQHSASEPTAAMTCPAAVPATAVH